MKIINEKGKLFGIINIVDLAVVLIIVLIAGALGYKLLGSKLSANESAKRTILVTVKCPKAPETAALAIKPGDKILSGTGYTNGTVESVRYESAKDTAVTADGKVITTEDPLLKDIYVVIQMKENPADPVLKLGNQEVRIGKDIFFKTQRVEIVSTVYNVEVQ